MNDAWQLALPADEEDEPRRCGGRGGDAHAIDRYEDEREGLGAEFWDELRTAMRTLKLRDRSADP